MSIRSFNFQIHSSLIGVVKKYIDFSNMFYTDDNIDSLEYCFEVFNKSFTDEEVKRYLNYACKYNHFKVVKFLVNKHKITEELFKDKFDSSYEIAAKFGNFAIVKWLLEKFKLTIGNKLKNIFIFKLICISGNIQLAEWFSDQPNIGLENVDFVIDNMFITICEKGLTGMAKWLVKKLGITLENLDEGVIDESFIRSCENGNMETSKWLIEHFNLSDMHVMINNNRAFKCACDNGHLELAKWLYKAYDLENRDRNKGPINFYSLCQDIFANACKNGDLEMVKWIYTIQRHTIEEVDTDESSDGYSNGESDSDEDYVPFGFACENGHLEVAKWIYNTVPLEKYEDDLDYAFEHAQANGQVEVVKWLYKTFILKNNTDIDCKTPIKGKYYSYRQMY